MHCCTCKERAVSGHSARAQQKKIRFVPGIRNLDRGVKKNKKRTTASSGAPRAVTHPNHLQTALVVFVVVFRLCSSPILDNLTTTATTTYVCRPMQLITKNQTKKQLAQKYGVLYLIDCLLLWLLVFGFFLMRLYRALMTYP